MMPLPIRVRRSSAYATVSLLLQIGVLHNSIMPVSSDGDQFASTLTCADLGWTLAPAGANVCGNGTVDGSCYTTTALSSSDAEDICLTAGARFCSEDEIDADVVVPGSCGVDPAQIWFMGSDLRSSCNRGSTCFVACCADIRLNRVDFVDYQRAVVAGQTLTITLSVSATAGAGRLRIKLRDPAGDTVEQTSIVTDGNE